MKTTTPAHLIAAERSASEPLARLALRRDDAVRAACAAPKGTLERVNAEITAEEAQHALWLARRRYALALNTAANATR